MSDINVLNYNLAVQKNLDQDEVRGPWHGILDAGFLDSNTQITPRDLYGRPTEPGLYWEMRTADPIIASIMSFRRDSVGSLDYDVVPRREGDATCEIAAKSVKWTLENMPFMNLNNFIAKTYDEVYSYGFCLYEMVVDEDGKFSLHHIPSFMIDWWILGEQRTSLDSVKIDEGDKVIQVDSRKFVWFGDQAYAGNYWGISDLRKLVAIFSARKQDLQNYLALRRLQQGVPYFKENGDHPNNENSWQVAANWLTQYFQGKPSPLILNAGMDFNYQSISIPGVDNASGMLSYFDALIREALGASLHNLGIGDAGGAYALGKELAISDAEQFKAHVDDFLQMLNGANAPESNLLAVITELLGFDPAAHTPKIVVRDNVAAPDAMENLDKLISLVKEGIIQMEDLPPDFEVMVLQELGFSYGDGGE